MEDDSKPTTKSGLSVLHEAHLDLGRVSAMGTQDVFFHPKVVGSERSVIGSQRVIYSGHPALLQVSPFDHSPEVLHLSKLPTSVSLIR